MKTLFLAACALLGACASDYGTYGYGTYSSRPQWHKVGPGPGFNSAVSECRNYARGSARDMHACMHANGYIWS